MNSENMIQSPFGVLYGISSSSIYPSGKIKDIILNEKNMIVTHIGELIPFYSEETSRRKYKSSVSYHENGMIKSVSLDEQTEVITPIGEFPAELVTFYDSGELKRIFILDGKISGFWSEEDERGLNIPFSFEFEFSEFSAMLIGICFYKGGDIKSLTLFPGELINISTKEYGEFSVRIGFSLFESGMLKSLEPSVPTAIKTPIGEINAYDINAIGVNADSNSVNFDEEGRLLSLITSSDKIAVQKPDGVMRFFVPIETTNMDEDDSAEIIPLKLEFDYENNSVTITDEKSYSFSISDCKFNIFKGTVSSECSPSDCANCNLCK